MPVAPQSIIDGGTIKEGHRTFLVDEVGRFSPAQADFSGWAVHDGQWYQH